MKRTIISAIFLVSIMNLCMATAQEEPGSYKVNWVPGVVHSIQWGKESSLIGVVMQDGEVFKFSSTNDKIEGIQVGDRILASVIGGWAVSIDRHGRAVEIPKPKIDSDGPQWVAGEITAIQTGKENSLVSVMMLNGENFNFSASNQMLHGMTEGDRVRAKVVKGWAETIERSR